MECAMVSFSGGGLKFWLEAYSTATQTNVSFTPKVTDANVSAVIKPKGTGALLASIPDGTAVGGNARGQYAVDLQLSRSSASHIAGGNYSVILGGSGNYTLTNPSEVGTSTYNTIVAGQNNRIYGLNGSHSFIGGGTNNHINGAHTSVISGGDSNFITYGTRWNVIGGGRSNSINGENEPNYRTIGGGYANSGGNVGFTISGGQSNACGAGQYPSIGGGLSNTASGDYSHIGGGQANTASASHSVVGGGVSNTASSANSVVVGGESNTASTNTHAFVGGGKYNIASGQFSFIGGGGHPSNSGDGNRATGNFSFVGGGTKNTASGTGSVVVGGGQNTAPNTAAGSYSFVGAGQNNSVSATSNWSSIVGGFSNTINDTNSQGKNFIGGGASNVITRGWSGIVSGLSNSTGQDNAFIGAGRSNTASGLYSGIVSGQSNTASATHTVVAGGSSNTASGSYSFVGGGSSNVAGFTNDTICGGDNNRLTGSNNSGYRFIGGGKDNQIQAEQVPYTTICGGFGNKIYFGSAGGFIGGGGYAAAPGGNFLTGMNSAIVGGQANRIGSSSPINYATYCFIGGGSANLIDQNADYSTIAGGANNTINNGVDFASIPGGYQAVAASYGQVAHASGRFSADGDAQAHELIWRRAITGTTTTELFLDGAAARAILPATNTVWKGIINIAAVCTNAGGGTTVVGDVAAIDYTVTVKRIAGNTVLVAAANNISALDSDPSMATSAFTIAADNTNEALTISYTAPTTADATTVIRVVATFRGLQIQY